MLEPTQEPNMSLEKYYKHVKKITKDLQPEGEHYATAQKDH